MTNNTKYCLRIRIPSNLVDKARKSPLMPGHGIFNNSDGSATILKYLDNKEEVDGLMRNLISLFPGLYEDLIEKSYKMLQVLIAHCNKTEGTPVQTADMVTKNSYLDSYVVPVVYHPLEIRPMETQTQWISRLLETLTLGTFVWAISQALEESPLSDDLTFTLPGTGPISIRLLKSAMKFREIRGFEPLLRKLELEVNRKKAAQSEINLLLSKSLSDFK